MTDRITFPRATVQQALEALWTAATPQAEEAIAALKAALEQPEQTCNCRWVGDVQTQQCTLHEAHIAAIHEWAERAKAAEAKLAALEQPEQEDAGTFNDGVLEGMLRERVHWLRQQKQEPVAWMYKGIKSNGTEHGPHLVWAPAYMDAMSAAKGVVASPLYTHPPRRETEPAFDALVAISLLTHLGGEVADYEDVVEAVRRLHAVNAELLKALKQMLEVWEEDPAYGATHADKARAAIARAEGKV